MITLTKGEIVQQPKSRFMKVKCLECESEQVIFSHASTEIACQKCGKILSKSSGGKAKLTPIARELEVLP